MSDLKVIFMRLITMCDLTIERVCVIDKYKYKYIYRQIHSHSKMFQGKSVWDSHILPLKDEVFLMADHEIYTLKTQSIQCI